MAKQLTRWRPDTCACVVDFEWDDADAEPIPVPKVIEPCPEHPTSGDLQADFDLIREHNRAANPEG